MAIIKNHRSMIAGIPGHFNESSLCDEILLDIDTLEVKDPYEQLIQYPSRELAIKAHAEDYSWNIESELFQQLTPEQQKLWRKEIEQAVISGGYSGLNLARDTRYKETLEVKDIEDFGERTGILET